MTWHKSKLSRESLELLAYVTARGEAGVSLEEIYAAFPDRLSRSVRQPLNNMRVGGYVERKGLGIAGVWLVSPRCRVPESSFPQDFVGQGEATPSSATEEGVSRPGADDEFGSRSAVVVIPRAPASVFNLGLLIDASEPSELDTTIHRPKSVFESHGWPFADFKITAVCASGDAPPAGSLNQMPSRLDTSALAAKAATGAQDLATAVAAFTHSVMPPAPLPPVGQDRAADDLYFDCALDLHGRLMICNDEIVIDLPPASVAKLAGYLAAIDLSCILALPARASA